MIERIRIAAVAFAVSISRSVIVPVVALVAVDSIADYVVVDCDQFGFECWIERNQFDAYDLFWIVDSESSEQFTKLSLKVRVGRKV